MGSRRATGGPPAFEAEANPPNHGWIGGDRQGGAVVRPSSLLARAQAWQRSLRDPGPLVERCTPASRRVATGWPMAGPDGWLWGAWRSWMSEWPLAFPTPAVRNEPSGVGVRVSVLPTGQEEAHSDGCDRKASCTPDPFHAARRTREPRPQAVGKKCPGTIRSAIAEKIAPRTRIYAGMAPAVRMTNCGRIAAMNTMVLGFVAPTVMPWRSERRSGCGFPESVVRRGPITFRFRKVRMPR